MSESNDTNRLDLYSELRKLGRKQAVAYVKDKWGLEYTTATFAKMAVTGLGPLHYKAGRAMLYDPIDLDAWARAKLGPKRRSTSDVATG